MLAEGRNRKILVHIAAVQISRNIHKPASAGNKLLNSGHKLRALLVAEDDVALLELLHLIGERLGHAARQHDYTVGILPPYAVDELAVFGVAHRGNGAGIYNGYIGFVLVLRQKIAVFKQSLAHSLGLILIHLAAERKYIKIHNFVLPFY